MNRIHEALTVKSQEYYIPKVAGARALESNVVEFLQTFANPPSYNDMMHSTNIKHTLYVHVHKIIIRKIILIAKLSLYTACGFSCMAVSQPRCCYIVNVEIGSIPACTQKIEKQAEG